MRHPPQELHGVAPDLPHAAHLQVYRARFNADIATLEPNLHRTATVDSRAVQAVAAAQSVLE